MEPFSGELAVRPLVEVVRSLYLGRGSGVLAVTGPSGDKRFHFVAGELYLPPASPLASQVASLLEAGRSDPRLHELLGRIATLIESVRDGRFEFAADEAATDAGLVGPLPTAELVMLGATRGGDESAWLEALGGERARLVCRTEPEVLARSVRLDADGVLLLGRLGQPRVLGQLLEEVDLPRATVLEKLCRLRAVELIRTVEQRPTGDDMASAAVVRRFSERVARQLETRPVEMDPGDHRKYLAGLLSRLAELDHYQLLGVEREADTPAIHQAYEHLARLVHPAHAERIGLAGKDEGMRVLFERATEAYLILSDPVRRATYDQELGRSGGPGTGPEQTERAKKTARAYFQQAQNLVEEEDYHYALELLRQAVKADPQVEYYLLMGEVQSKNPKWLHRAADAYREALQLEPDNLEVRLALGEAFERLGEPQRALGVYRSILIREPDHAAAAAAVALLQQNLGKRKRKGGFLRRLFGR